MKSGYKILWTDNALQELEATLNYLKEKWTAKELKNLAVALEKKNLFSMSINRLFYLQF
jgi:plasmid stabilization system protein ParE